MTKIEISKLALWAYDQRLPGKGESKNFSTIYIVFRLIFWSVIDDLIETRTCANIGDVSLGWARPKKSLDLTDWWMRSSTGPRWWSKRSLDQGYQENVLVPMLKIQVLPRNGTNALVFGLSLGRWSRSIQQTLMDLLLIPDQDKELGRESSKPTKDIKEQIFWSLLVKCPKTSRIRHPGLDIPWSWPGLGNV